MNSSTLFPTQERLTPSGLLGQQVFDGLGRLHDQENKDKIIKSFCNIHALDSVGGGGYVPPLPKIDFNLKLDPLDFKANLPEFTFRTPVFSFKPETTKIGFFTPVVYLRPSDAAKEHGLRGRAVEFFDSYFSLGGKELFVTKAVSGKEGHGTELYIRKQPWYMIALKVLSYATIVIPVVMLIGKAIARSQIQYKVEKYIPEVTYQETPVSASTVRSQT